MTCMTKNSRTPGNIDTRGVASLHHGGAFGYVDRLSIDLHFHRVWSLLGSTGDVQTPHASRPWLGSQAIEGLQSPGSP